MERFQPECFVRRTAECFVRRTAAAAISLHTKTEIKSELYHLWPLGINYSHLQFLILPVNCERIRHSIANVAWPQRQHFAIERSWLRLQCYGPVAIERSLNHPAANCPDVVEIERSKKPNFLPSFETEKTLVRSRHRTWFGVGPMTFLVPASSAYFHRSQVLSFYSFLPSAK